MIIKPSSLGDIVHALPVLAALRAAYPSAHIAWLVGASFVSLLKGHPLLDEVIPFDRARYGRMLQSPRAFRDFIGFLARIRARRFDLIVDLQGLFRSGFIAWIAGTRRRIGFADAREFASWFYTRRVRCPRPVQHAVEKNLCVAAALNLPGKPEFPLGLREDEVHAARELLNRAASRSIDRFNAVLPGARWPSKLWRPDALAELIDRSQANGQPICVLLGAAADRPFADKVAAACRSPVVNLVGHTGLRELVALLALSERVICHDSGPMHIAAALNKPLVAIFGPTAPARTGPYSASARVARLPLECSPCYHRVCPLGPHACMETLSADQVYLAFESLGAQGTGDQGFTD